MSKLYWRPQQISRSILVLVTIFSLFGYVCVEVFQIKKKQPHYKEKIQAAKLARKAFDAIKTERLERGLTIDAEVDPSQSGLIGELITPITTNPGVLTAKQTTVNPNFAAVLVEMLKSLGLREKDRVAVSYSGSFPALNICVGAALQTLQLEPIVISSVASSQWGANHPEFLWLDMEQTLLDRKIFTFRSSAASVGGIEDRGLGMTKKGRKIIKEAIAEHNLPFIEPENFVDSINRRMATYRQFADDFPIKAYVNVGGGTISVGTKVGKKMFRPGVNLRPPGKASSPDSMMYRFSSTGIPVIHLVKIETLAKQYGLPVQPRTIPALGEGEIFMRKEYNQWLAGGVLFFTILLMFAFIRTEWGFRIFQKRRGKSTGPSIGPAF